MKYKLTWRGLALIEVLGPAPDGSTLINSEQLKELTSREIPKEYLILTGIYADPEDPRGVEMLSAIGPYADLSTFVEIFYDYGDKPMDYEYFRDVYETEWGGIISEGYLRKLVSGGMLEVVPEY